MTNPARKPEPTAAETFAKNAADIARLMDVLQMELDRHAKLAAANPADWGFAGNLGKVLSDLIDTVAFISNTDRERIEAFLADAE